MNAYRREEIPQADLLDAERLIKRLETDTGDGALLRRAHAAAAAAHSGQLRRGGEPYLVHPARVALSLRFELGTTDPEGLAAALVHDVIEDGPGWTLDRLRAEVGERVTNMAAALTEDSTLERPHRYMVYWQALGAAEETARLVKIADRVDNLRDALALPGATVEFLRRNLFRTRMRFIPFLEEHATPGAELVDAACADIERRVAELEGRDPNASPLCPVCGWDLGHSVATIAPGIVCPSCGFTFGADAQALSPAQSHARWRWDWLQAGAPWRGGADPPMGWNPLAQLKRIGVEPPPAL